MFSSEWLEKTYSAFKWIEDPFTREGFERYKKILESMDKIVEHKWIREVIEKRDKIRIIDLCGGTGLAGIALAKKIVGLGKKVDVTIVDLRSSALEKAREFSVRELGYSVETIEMNVLDIHRLDRKYDIALLWGHTTPHFSPWDYARLCAGLTKILDRESVYIYEETDRFYTIAMMGYKYFLIEAVSDENIVATIHVSRDPLTGYIVRKAVDLITRKTADLHTYLWDISSSACITWMFFQDIDFIPETRYRGYIVAYKPFSSSIVEKILFTKPTMINKQL